MKPGTKRFDPEFPKPVKIGHGSVAWVESEVDAWISARMAERD
jgi:prophage regulatory protein